MSYPGIRIEGAILSPDILERVEDLPGQKPVDFGFDSSVKVKDEIARAWADAQDYWRIFQRKLETLKDDAPATTETRQQWMAPLLGLLGYQLDFQTKGAELNGKIYSISHRASNRALAPVQIVGYREPSGLDRKPERSNLRMSAHAIVQEYLNLNEQLYGIVTNGRVLRLLRDSSRLVKLSYLEFDLDRIFSDGLFADFAILYRLCHATRLPISNETAAESVIEGYHQDSLESGARIRSGLSRAVETAIVDFGNGFLTHPENTALKKSISDGSLSPEEYYKNLLRLIYRLLFLMVIEERDLVFPLTSTRGQRDTYQRYYSVQRLRLLSEKRYLADKRRDDLWLALLANFRLFESDGVGNKLGIAPLAGDLFNHNSLGPLVDCILGNDVLMGCLRSLSLYENPENHQLIRVNYAALNVEEFGSVYEGLLEFHPVFESAGAGIQFAFKAGDERATSGSHYTPDELVQPLIKSSLDYKISVCRKAADPEGALLGLRIADISCGSGHILLAAARRVATELASVRTKEDQPSPIAFRAALRDVIRTCIYGVDLNPLAVELCKVALWLEAHNPGQPLNFLDHHIKCGNAIVGYVSAKDMDKGIPDEAFSFRSGDDKDIASLLRKTNKKEVADHAVGQLQLTPNVQLELDTLVKRWESLSKLPEATPAEIETKKCEFAGFVNGDEVVSLHRTAALPIAQFYLPKTIQNKSSFVTDAEFRRYLADHHSIQTVGVKTAFDIATERRFFNWFLEFPEIISHGGFDCILGNPPYLGGQDLSGTYGHPFCAYVKWEYSPAGLSDLVVYFVRRIYSLLKPNGFMSFITTNSIKDGDIRKDGLEQIIAQDATINMAVRGIKWPGRAKLVVSLVSIVKGKWSGKKYLDGKEVPVINAYFEDVADAGHPVNLLSNAGKMFQGSIVLGDGFLLTYAETNKLITANPNNAAVISPVINGDELNNHPEQVSNRNVINFQDWSKDKASQYSEPFAIVEAKVKPKRLEQKDKGGQEYWWRHLRPRKELYLAIGQLRYCFVAAATTKYLNFSAVPVNYVFTHALFVYTTDRWDLYALVQSTIHEVWARKYSGSLETRLRYSPSDCFENFPFPNTLHANTVDSLAEIGERYHTHRKSLMAHLWLGLTDIYNLFHNKALSPEVVSAISGKKGDDAIRGFEGILELRHLHLELDNVVKDVYGWHDIDLGHGFHEIETLPENDRVRYTVSPSARKELQKRLLVLNQTLAKVEADAAPKKNLRNTYVKKSEIDNTPKLF